MRRVYRIPRQRNWCTTRRAGLDIPALPCCAVAGVGARVALQRCPILRTGEAIPPRFRCRGYGGLFLWFAVQYEAHLLDQGQAGSVVELWVSQPARHCSLKALELPDQAREAAGQPM